MSIVCWYILTRGITRAAQLVLYSDDLRLSKAAIGEFLGEYDAFNMEVLYEFVDLMGFGGMPFDAALRHFLSFFRLPGEGITLFVRFSAVFPLWSDNSRLSNVAFVCASF
jgi:hypothetical protein